jgi:N-methylhydantoinase B
LIGGPVPAGYNPNATEIYAECLRIPPVKIWDRGKPRNDVINLIFTNMRARRDQEGDFNALIGACQVGERNLLGMIEKYGIDQTDACIGELLDMADRHMRSLIKAVPDGVYQGTAILEDAGHGHGDIEITATLSPTSSLPIDRAMCACTKRSRRPRIRPAPSKKAWR